MQSVVVLRVILLGLSLGLIIPVVCSAGDDNRPPRVFTVDDLLAQEVVDGVSISPSHEMVALVRWRPTSGISGIGRFRGEVWIASISAAKSGHEIRRIDSLDPTASYSNLLWSPDGSMLAMRMVDSTSGWHLVVWDVHENRVIRLGSKDTPMTYEGMRSFAWVGNRHVATIASSKNSALNPALPGLTTTERIGHETLDAFRGERASSHLVDSGAAFDPKAFPEDSLVLLGVDGQSRKLASGVRLAEMQVSPDGQHIAFLRQIGVRRLDNTTKFDYDFDDFGGDAAKMIVEIVDATGQRLAIQQESMPIAKLSSFAWSMDGNSFAFIGSREETLVLRVFRGSLGDTNLEEMLSDSDVVPQSVVWTRDGLAIAAGHSTKSGMPARCDWWHVASHGSTKLITGEFFSPMADLNVLSRGRFLVGMADSAIWRFDLDAQKWTDLTAAFGLGAQSILSIDNRQSHSDRVLTSDRVGGMLQSYSLNIATGVSTRIDTPSPLARPIAYDGDKDTIVFQANEPTGTSVTVRHNGILELLLEVNRGLAEISPGSARSFTYTSEDGQSLTGWLLLPPFYKKGNRYPLVTWVYPGSMQSPGRYPTELRLNENRPTNFIPLQLFAAHGYAVMMPSMPLPPRGQPTDVFLELTKGVMPAVDEVIRMGIADPQRLAVAGHSFGGYGVDGLISQTTRFSAAIALAGPSDLVSFFGTFSNQGHYQAPSPRQNAGFRSMNVSEAGALHMANPPWLDSGRYLRNSPVIFADRIHTPLLLIQGDMDEAVPNQQSDEMFTALLRQHKRARYMHFTGEGHIINSPPNIRELWRQMLDWFDQYLAPVLDGK